MGTPTEPERGGERPISPRDKGGTKGADTRSVGQRRHGTQKTKEYHEQLRRDKDDAARVAMEFLDKLGELPAVHADKTRFGADDVRWAAIKQLLTGLADGTEEQPADALIHDQILRHLLGVGSAKTPAYTKIVEGKGGNLSRQRREEELLRVTHVLACAQPLSGPRSREQPLDVGAPVRARKQRVAPSTAFAVYFEEQLSSTDDSLSQQDAMCLLAERCATLAAATKAQYSTELARRQQQQQQQ